MWSAELCGLQGVVQTEDLSVSLLGIERATCGPFVPLRSCDFLELLSSLFLKPT